MYFQLLVLHKKYSCNLVILAKSLIFALSILHEQTTAKARSKLVG